LIVSGEKMEIVLGIILIACAVAVGVIVSPMLMMAGVMGASDDPGGWTIEKILGIGAIAVAMLLPIFMFFLGLSKFF
jgi:hypothetical protein